GSKGFHRIPIAAAAVQSNEKLSCVPRPRATAHTPSLPWRSTQDRFLNVRPREDTTKTRTRYRSPPAFARPRRNSRPPPGVHVSQREARYSGKPTGTMAMKSILRHTVTRGRQSTMSLLCLTVLVTLAAGAGSSRAGDQPKTALKTESFDKD